MYQLFCAPNTYAMGAHVLLEEIGEAYEIVPVTLFADEQPDEFVAASPHTRVPALIHEHGTLFESGAIALYLADKHEEKCMSIPLDDPRRASYLQWMVYLSSTLQPEVLIQFHPEFYFEARADQRALQVASMRRLSAIWPILNKAYEQGPYLFGDLPNAVDVCLAIQAQWPQCFPASISQYGNIERMLVEMQARPAYQRAMKWHSERMTDSA